ncbi:GreA/GreB family elongation factor [Myxococcota bacterium]|nr:GreA/GreB family elongation factor [Myxococcota bacterium]
MGSDRRFFIQQLELQYQERLAIARRAEEDAREAAKSLATESEKREDGRVALEYGSLATGQAGRAQRLREELDALAAFSKRDLPRFGRKTPIELGAIVDLATESDDGEPEERTFILLPVGAGSELTGPSGDGFISVITPASPIGRGLLGRKAGDGIDVPIQGEWRSWEIVDVS